MMNMHTTHSIFQTRADFAEKGMGIKYIVLIIAIALCTMVLVAHIDSQLNKNADYTDIVRTPVDASHMQVKVLKQQVAFLGQR